LADTVASLPREVLSELVLSEIEGVEWTKWGTMF